MVDRDGCEGWWDSILLCKIFKINSYFFPIFSGKFLIFSYFLGARIPIFLFFWPFLLLDALSAPVSDSVNTPLVQTNPSNSVIPNDTGRKREGYLLYTCLFLIFGKL